MGMAEGEEHRWRQYRKTQSSSAAEDKQWRSQTIPCWQRESKELQLQPSIHTTARKGPEITETCLYSCFLFFHVLGSGDRHAHWFVQVSTVLMETRRGHQILWRHGCWDPPKLQEQQVQGSRDCIHSLEARASICWVISPRSHFFGGFSFSSANCSFGFGVLVGVCFFEKTSPAARAGLTLSIQLLGWGGPEHLILLSPPLGMLGHGCGTPVLFTASAVVSL